MFFLSDDDAEAVFEPPKQTPKIRRLDSLWDYFFLPAFGALISGLNYF
ncbi:MAG: hypothetical protein JXR73_12725 [Candidatus Omnitrophica bacterium]|nr:hypothetical protein [Candidatus Omnitrophota bacterium]